MLEDNDMNNYIVCNIMVTFQQEIS